MGPVECARTILRLEGVKAFYKGMVRWLAACMDRWGAHPECDLT